MRQILNPGIAVLLGLWVMWNGAAVFAGESAVPDTTRETSANHVPAITSAKPPCEYSATFTQVRQVTGIPIPLKSTGRLLYACHHGMVWQTDEPVRETIVYTRDKTHFSISADRIAKQLNDLVHANMATLLLPLMAGDMSELARRFSISVDGTTTDVLPRDQTTARFLNRVSIEDHGDGATITLVDSRDQKTDLSVANIMPLPALDLSRCMTIMGAEPLPCSALLFPQKLAAEITADR